MQTIDGEYIKEVLSIRGTSVSDDLIDFLIEHYTEVIKIKTGLDDETSPLFQMALIAAIGCHLSMTNPEAVKSPKMEKVGDWQEERESRAYTPTWCEIYDAALEDIIKSIEGAYGFTAFERQGSYERHGFY